MFRRASFASIPNPQPATWSLREYLCLMMQGRYDMIGEAPPEASCVDYQEQAERFYRKLDIPPGCDPRWALDELGIRFQASLEVNGEVREVYSPERGVRYSPKGGPQRWGIRVWHGFEHHICDDLWGKEWTHSDIWLATIEMAIPSYILLAIGAERAAEVFPYVPSWLIRDYWDALTGQL